MAIPYGPAFAALCLFHGALVATPARRVWHAGRSTFVGLAVPVIVFGVGLAAIRGGDWSREALTLLATFGTPVAAGFAGWFWGWRSPWLVPMVALVAWVVAWRASDLTADVASLVLIGLACLTFASLIAAFTPAWTLALGLVVLAVVDSIFVFTDQVRPGTRALHAVVPPEAAGRPLPSLQDATLGRASFGWLDVLTPALVATLLAGWTRARIGAAILTAGAALALGLLLAVTKQVPGTIPPLAGVAVWAITTPSPLWPRPRSAR